MFWGLVLEPGKRYSTTVDKSFHVSMAALDCSSVKSDTEVLSVILECDGQENILCNLSNQHKLLQSHLDLNFMTGDKVVFEIKGNGIVHLSGYLVPEEDEDDDEYMNIPDFDEDVEDEEEESVESPKKNDKNKQKGKRKDPPQLNEHKGKKLKVSEDSDEDSDEDDDEDDDDEEEEESVGEAAAVGTSDEDEEDDDDSDEEEDDDSDEDEEMADSEEEETPVQSKKQKTPQSVNKKQQQTPNKQTPGTKQQQSANKQNSVPLVNGSGPNQQSSNKKNKKKANQGQETPKTPIQNDKTKNQKTPVNEAGSPQQKKKLEGGVLVKDIKEGNGPVAKNGQMVSVFYQGRLKSNNKMFDECKRGGPPFKFRLGKGEVIKGWDIGVSGMKVGGIRSITCPPNMGYGQKGSPPQIPPNSGLVFQVELKAVN